MPTLTANQDQEVSIVEQGTFVIDSRNVSITGDGNFQLDFTVPVGKNWTLKNVIMGPSTGTFTIGGCTVLLVQGGIAAQIDYVAANTITSPQGEQNMNIPAGTIVRCQFAISGHSVTGNTYGTVIYQESDI